jgi:Predicted ester cyclase
MSVLPDIYRAYLDCLNQQDLARLGEYVDEAVVHNGRHLGLAGYRAMIEADFRQIPDLRYEPELVVCEPPLLAARLMFNCTPWGSFSACRSTAGGSRLRRTSSMRSRRGGSKPHGR